MLVSGVATEGLLPEASLGGGIEDDGSNSTGDEHQVPHIVEVTFGGDGGEQVICAEDSLQVVFRATG